MGRWNVTLGSIREQSSPTATTQVARVSIPVGRWMKGQGKAEASTSEACCHGIELKMPSVEETAHRPAAKKSSA